MGQIMLSDGAGVRGYNLHVNHIKIARGGNYSTDNEDQQTHRALALFLAAKKKSALFISLVTSSLLAATGTMMHPSFCNKAFDEPNALKMDMIVKAPNTEYRTAYAAPVATLYMVLDSSSFDDG